MPGRFNTIGSIGITNRGRTVAFIESIGVGWDFAAVLPSAPYYKAFSDYIHGVLMPKDLERSVDLPRLTIECNKECESDLICKTKVFRVFVTIIYIDFMDNRHHTNMCWEWGCPEGVGEHHFFPVTNVPAIYYSKS